MKAIEVGAISSPSVRRLLDVTAPSETAIQYEAPQEVPTKQEPPKKK